MRPTWSEWHHAANMLTPPLYFHATPLTLGRLLQLETTKVGALSHMLLQSVISHACSQCSQTPSQSQGTFSIFSAAGAGSEGWVRKITSSAMLNGVVDYGQKVREKGDKGRGGEGIGREGEGKGRGAEGRGREKGWRGGEAKGDLTPVGLQDTSSNVLLCTAARGCNARRHMLALVPLTTTCCSLCVFSA